MKKIKEILCSVGAVAATVLPVAVMASCAQTKDQEKATSYTVNFDAGEGKIVSGETKIKLPSTARLTFGDLHKPEVEAEGKTFTGWTCSDSGGNSIDFSDKEVINHDITVKANFVGSTGIYKKVKFAAKTGETGVHFTGNTTVAVKPGYPFFTVNKPTATLDGHVFGYWATKSGDTYTKFKETDEINDNLTLYAVFNAQISVVYSQPTTPTGVTFHGPQTIAIADNTKFKNVARPNVTKEGYYFAGWYSDAACSEGKEVGDETVLHPATGSTINIYPKMEQGISGWGMLTYALKTGETGATISGDPYAYFPMEGKTFANITHVQVSKPGYKLGPVVAGTANATGWAFKNGDQYTDVLTTTTATDLKGKTVYANFVPDVAGMITGDTEIYSQTAGYKYTPHIYPASMATGATYEYSIQDWTASPSGGTTPSITNPTSPATEGTVTTVDTGTFKVKVTVTFAGGGTLDIVTNPITISNPGEVTDTCWVHDATDGWVLLNYGSLFDVDSPIKGVSLGKKPYSKARNAFDDTVYIGAQTTNLAPGFLCGCTALTHAPVFKGTAITKIGENFLQGCTSFNAAVTLPTTITKIGDGFLSGCTTYNKAIDLSDLTALTEIGNGFLARCTAFNSAITLADSITTIGNEFLMKCTSFDQDIDLSALTLTSVGAAFMYDCSAFVTGTLTLPATVTMFDESDATVAIKQYSESYTGVKVAGDGAAAFKTRFPATEQASEPYRKYAA